MKDYPEFPNLFYFHIYLLFGTVKCPSLYKANKSVEDFTCHHEVSTSRHAAISCDSWAAVAACTSNLSTHSERLSKIKQCLHCSALKSDTGHLSQLRWRIETHRTKHNPAILQMLPCFIHIANFLWIITPHRQKSLMKWQPLLASFSIICIAKMLRVQYSHQINNYKWFWMACCRCNYLYRTARWEKASTCILILQRQMRWSDPLGDYDIFFFYRSEQRYTLFKIYNLIQAYGHMGG